MDKTQSFRPVTEIIEIFCAIAGFFTSFMKMIVVVMAILVVGLVIVALVALVFAGLGRLFT